MWWRRKLSGRILKTLINKCIQCGQYTMRRDSCPYCGGEVKSAHPPNISLESRYLDLILKIRRKRFNNEEASIWGEKDDSREH
ncbi:MAG: nucleolar RNA-binding Nop10p family protein [Nitrososphaerota archaeon]